MIKNRPILFVHIPKTAGTSFRMAMENYFGLDNIVCDYGYTSSKTHKLIKKWAYDSNDLFTLYKELTGIGTQVITGHVPLNKYLGIIPVNQILTFVRDPVQQIISHFSHHKRNNKNYKKSFSDFLSSQESKNFQSRMLNGSPLECIGFVGVTERYAECVQFLNTEYELDLPCLNMNINPCSSPKESIGITREIEQGIKKNNMQDLKLVHLANSILTKRLSAQKLGQQFIRCKITHVGHNLIRGFAYRASDEEPVTVNISVNDDVIATSVVASAYRPALGHLQLPRKAYIGFDFKLKKELNSGDRISCFSDSGQIIASNTYI